MAEQDNDELTDMEREIVHLLFDTDATLKPACIARNIGGRAGRNRKSVGKSCRGLMEKGYLARAGEGWYKIAVKGRLYVAGELDAEGLEKADR